MSDQEPTTSGNVSGATAQRTHGYGWTAGVPYIGDAGDETPEIPDSPAPPYQEGEA